MYPRVVVVKRPVFELAAAPQLPRDLQRRRTMVFKECTVRAVELKLKKASPGKRVALRTNDSAGLVMVRPASRRAGLKK
jgi:hypothetical protein